MDEKKEQLIKLIAELSDEIEFAAIELNDGRCYLKLTKRKPVKMACTQFKIVDNEGNIYE